MKKVILVLSLMMSLPMVARAETSADCRSTKTKSVYYLLTMDGRMDGGELFFRNTVNTNHFNAAVLETTTVQNSKGSVKQVSARVDLGTSDELNLEFLDLLRCEDEEDATLNVYTRKPSGKKELVETIVCTCSQS